MSKQSKIQDKIAKLSLSNFGYDWDKDLGESEREHLNSVALHAMTQVRLAPRQPK